MGIQSHAGAVLCALAFWLATAAQGGTFQFEPVDDAYLANSTLFNDNYLKVRAGIRVSYLKFAVEGLSSAVHRVTLQLQENGDTGSGTLQFHRGSHNDWTETTLSTTNAPAEDGQVGTFTGPVTAAKIIDVDVTPLLEGDGTYSIIVKMNAGGSALQFGSSESRRKPRLIIETVSTLTVQNGTGSGTYPAGEIVDIVADTPADDLQFDHWTGDSDGIADTNATATTFTMPDSDALITATYKAREFTLTVNNGTGSGNYPAGATVDIVADDPLPDFQFDQWTGDSDGIADVFAPATAISMPATDATVTATYKPLPFTLTVNGGTGSGSYVPGATVDIVAAAPSAEQQFDQWTGDIDGIADVNAASTSIRMPAADATITATYKARSFILTVNRGTGSGSYIPGEIISIVADEPTSEYPFKYWTGAVAGLADVNAASTTMTMPATDVTITAIYTGPQFVLTVVNGSGSGSYSTGEIIRIVADPPPLEYLFDQWTGDTNGIADGQAALTSLIMPETDTTITASYKLTEGIGSVGSIAILTATGDRGLITSINRIPVSELLLGVTTFPGFPHPTFPAVNADNFDLNMVGSADGQAYFDCSFPQPVMTVFLIENGGNDSGFMRGLDAMGTLMGPAVSFTTNSYFISAYQSGVGQAVAGLAVRMNVPVHGIRVFPAEATIMGFDPISISASPRPWLELKHEPADDSWQLVWFGSNWVLQHASGPNEEWSDLSPPANSPHPIVPDNGSRLFRLKQAGPE